jgi:hypothetical protein
VREAFPKMHSDQSSCSRMATFRGALMGRGSCLVAACLLHVARTTSAADQLFCGEHGAAAGGWCRCVDGALAVNMSQHPLAVSACGLHNGKHHHHHMHLVGHCICVKSEYVGNVEPSNLCGARGRPNTVVVGERTSPRAARTLCCGTKLSISLLVRVHLCALSKLIHTMQPSHLPPSAPSPYTHCHTDYTLSVTRSLTRSLAPLTCALAHSLTLAHFILALMRTFQ